MVLCDCKPALQQIENAHRKGIPEGLRDWERGGLLEAIAHYRSKLEAVVFLWVPAHVGIRHQLDSRIGVSPSPYVPPPPSNP